VREGGKERERERGRERDTIFIYCNDKFLGLLRCSHYLVGIKIVLSKTFAISFVWWTDWHKFIF